MWEGCDCVFVATYANYNCKNIQFIKYSVNISYIFICRKLSHVNWIIIKAKLCSRFPPPKVFVISPDMGCRVVTVSAVLKKISYGKAIHKKREDAKMKHQAWRHTNLPNVFWNFIPCFKYFTLYLTQAKNLKNKFLWVFIYQFNKYNLSQLKFQYKIH